MPRKEVNLSEAVNDLLDAAAPTLKDLARDSGVSYAAIRSWVTEGRVPRDKTLNRLLNAVELRQREVDRLVKQLRRASR